MRNIMKITLVVTAAIIVLAGNEKLPAADGNTPDVLEKSQFVTEIPLVKDAASKWLEFQVPSDMFDGARWDLADLRLLDAADKEVPYALRVRLPRSMRQPMTASAFNRGTTPEGAAELSLDLGETPQEHNEVSVQTVGDGFRRRAVLHGSDDRETWIRLAEKQLLRFTTVRERFEDDRIEYPASRFRYLRVRVEKDSEDREPVEFGAVVVRRTIEVPGEMITLAAKLGPREPSRNEGVTGSAWLIDLGGRQVPCQKLEFDIDDDEFVRDFVVTAEDADSAYPWDDPRYWGGWVNPGNPYRADDSSGESPRAALREAFTRFGSTQGTWRRRAGDPQAPLTIDMGNVRAGKLRLFVADAANPPLKLTQVRFVAASCVVVLANLEETRGPLRAYYGNLGGETPSYDFARNLPARLEPPPARLKAQSRTDNLSYIPPPRPFTERFAWLIHCVLGGVSLLLAALVFQLARRVIARHDARAASAAESSPT